MDAKKIFSVFLLIIAEALVIICFLYFGNNLDSKILTLNICVTSIILLILYFDIILPRIDLKDKAQKAIGTLGVKGVVGFIYMFLSIGAMISFNINEPVVFYTQLIVHGILFLFLGIGMYYIMSLSDKVLEVYKEEKKNRGHVDEMKNITKEVRLKIDQMKEIPTLVTERINALQDNLRFISSTDNQEAFLLESSYVNEMKKVWDSLFDTPLNFDKILELINNCERVYKERKQQYSN